MVLVVGGGVGLSVVSRRCVTNGERCVVNLPLAIVRERYLAGSRRRPFVQRATFFEDLVVRCVRYAFSEIPARVGRVFFAKEVAKPFLRFRMLRRGYLRGPFRWNEHEEVSLGCFLSVGCHNR